jgi:polyhydroxyalkanoate synthase
MTDDSAFEVGRNHGDDRRAPSSIENELIQFIQYSPLTDKVAKRPLVIVPPCINKFYILDLQAENSFDPLCGRAGQHRIPRVLAQCQGRARAFRPGNDYLEQGPIALRCLLPGRYARSIGSMPSASVLVAPSFPVRWLCLQARGEDWVSSLTLLTTLLDFSDTGEIGLFIDEQSCATRDATIGKGGLLTGRDLAGTFSALRANDLVWNYVSGNYLKGQKPQAFDLLYWNSDSTNLPGPFAAWYMRNLYLNNSLRIPDKLEMCGVKVDLGRVKMPNYLLAAREDHIVPWQTAYQSTRLLGGEARFVLGASAATSPGLSIRRQRTSAVTGSMTKQSSMPMSGYRQPKKRRAAGGLIGLPG